MITKFLSAFTLVGVMGLSGAPAYADGGAGSSVPGQAEGMHNMHPAIRGTDEAPLDVVRDPSDLPASPTSTGPGPIQVDLQSVEVNGRLADGAVYHYWTFDQKVPGPLVRARAGQTINVNLTNVPDAMMNHSVDLHAVNGPGGGGVFTQAKPGETKGFTFKALSPGLYVYHCATPPVAEHVASGMYGLILVEPEGGLPKVDREFYVMQGEMYTKESFGSKGELSFSRDRLLAEAPEYFVFNGAVGALSVDQHSLKAKVGETIRIYFGNAGPNKTSSFHVIGEVFDKVYNLGSLSSPPITDVQTVSVPSGGAVAVELRLNTPGDYLIVDHALARLQRGLVGTLKVDGSADPSIFSDRAPAGTR
ncbi:copper-containing nitrite reductase [Ciceribacter thiooxidans]|uniref:Copper-containing nitrite reductase n=1 Tax=Ciceribacter thiooxidans TaxID=1969821 RepID=A0ABV7I524_9HYPH|nr:copper-containing nitrite reductase [Ciceribacter thiooxidans]